MAAGSGADSLIGGQGSDTMFAGTGNSTLTGSGSNDLFVFSKGAAGGVDVITDLGATDSVVLIGYGGAAAVIAALAGATVSGGSTTISLSDNTKVVFSNVTNLSASNFLTF